LCAANKTYQSYNRKGVMKTVSLAQTESTASAAISEMALSVSSLSVRSSDQRYRNQTSGLSATRTACTIAALILLALLAACSDDKPAETAKPEPKGPELILARSALQKVYVAARGWNQDARPYRIESSLTSDGNGHDGKSAIWRGSFASATQRTEKTYTWSGSAADGAPSRGVNPGIEDSYSASNSSTQVFDIAFLKIDTDAAFATALKHGGDKILEKEPNTTVVYFCDWNHNTNQLVWHVIFGTRESPKLTVAVNASSGEFIRVEK
jgi:hypothetical protein